ncbi:MAG: hypothetical protein OXG16_09100 [Rhodospirillales bacterium]|nr:hypothetical protein [Rhodospirillales bacterium]
MRGRASSAIKADIREEFEAILRGALSELERESAGSGFAERVPGLVESRVRLLLDTLLNYLVDDAREFLAKAPSSIKNDFFTLDLRTRTKERAAVYDPGTMDLSKDPRVLAGGVASGAVALVGITGTIMMVSSPVLRIASLLATGLASTVAYRVGRNAATGVFRSVLEKDLRNYVLRAQHEAEAWLAGVEEAFVADFNEFLAGVGEWRGADES